MELEQLIARYFGDPSWVSALVSILALLVALRSVSIAVREARAKEREAKARAEDARTFAEALKTVISAGDTMPQHLRKIADQTSAVTELARKQIQETVEHLKRACDAADGLARELTELSKEVRRSQRDSLKAHQEFLETIRFSPKALGTAPDS